ncbi:hypothetical protein IWQ60_003663 [Tieghemiomyces parasiticus]|uniref:Uncharacterized protein n=1 Tax=Tieghemiomyces parasiticus TaxID=78921 RepID=A0A9W8E010_9FUNG|nr:hypothetical protein IWQ60_003663 [Tieghemiomyces parasiticus]
MPPKSKAVSSVPRTAISVGQLMQTTLLITAGVVVGIAIVENYGLLAPIQYFLEFLTPVEHISLLALAFTAFWSFSATALLSSYVIGIANKDKGVEIAEPRLQKAHLTGIASRAHGAHVNAIETFSLFASAVILAYVTGVPVHVCNSFALLHAGARVVHTFAYLADWRMSRAICWTICTVTSLGLYAFATFPGFSAFYRHCLFFLGGARHHLDNAPVARSIYEAVRGVH